MIGRLVGDEAVDVGVANDVKNVGKARLCFDVLSDVIDPFVVSGRIVEAFLEHFDVGAVVDVVPVGVLCPMS